MSTQNGSVISLTNVGPIKELAFTLESPGVTILEAPNGSGKSIALDAIQSAAAGKGKVPLRDQTKRGKVEAMGAKISIGSNCRHTGEFETHNIEGRFDIGALIDPKLKSAEAADNSRIKALVSLLGVSADASLFKEHEAFSDFEEVVSERAKETDDLVEMARRIKGDYDAAARQKAKDAEREDGHVAALDPDPELDLSAESDEEVLRENYDNARDQLKEINTRRDAYLNLKERADSAKESLEKAEPVDVDAITEKRDATENELAAYTSRIEELKDELRAVAEKKELTKERLEHLNEQLHSAKQSEETRQSLQDLLAKFENTACPTASDVEKATEAVELSKSAMELGVRVRQAKESCEKAASHKSKASAARESEARYRDAGRAVDDVLSGAINCDELRVESDGKSARLVTSTSRGDSTPYHDLSDGERGRIAIDIASKCVGDGGLVVVSQSVWEELDGANRRIIHDHAVQRNVYILTAEASQDENAAREIQPHAYEGVASEQGSD